MVDEDTEVSIRRTGRYERKKMTDGSTKVVEIIYRICSVRMASQVTGTPIDDILRKLRSKGYFKNEKWTIRLPWP